MAIVGFPERDPRRAARAGARARRDRGDGRAQRRGRALRRARCGVSIARCTSPTTGCSTSNAISGAGDPSGATIELGGHRIGVTVCEDLWVAGPPASAEAGVGASLIVNISASPYHAGKGLERERLFAERARETGAHVAFCAMVGGQDELVFDGHSFVLDADGETIARAAQFEEDMLVCDLALDLDGDAGRAPVSSTPRRAAHTNPLGRAGGVRGAAAGLARLRREERLRRGGARALGRDRLGARGLPGRGRARARARQRGDHAVLVLLLGDPGGRARARSLARRQCT